MTRVVNGDKAGEFVVVNEFFSVHSRELDACEDLFPLRAFFVPENVMNEGLPLQSQNTKFIAKVPYPTVGM